MANESRLEVVDGRARRTVATGVGVVPLVWLAMFRRADLASSGPVRFTTLGETAHARLAAPFGLQAMFAEYGDVTPYTRALSETLAARGARGASRVSVAAGEIAGEHPDPRAWARALGAALDALDDPAPEPAPWDAPSDASDMLTPLEKIQRLRRAADLGIGDARALLAFHGGDLDAALDAIEQGKSPEQRARDKAGAFVAALVNPTEAPVRPPWRVLVDVSGLAHGRAFPDVDLLHRVSVPQSDDVRAHARLLGESAMPGGVSWEPPAPPGGEGV